MNATISSRIVSIDFFRGIIMVVMALDHVRDFFHYGAYFYDPTDLTTTTPILFFTRFITHICAPAFVFLAGTSAFLFGQKRSKKDLSAFLFTRGFWLVFFEVFIMSFLWSFDINYSIIYLQVIWAIGISMIVLSALIHLNLKYILIFGLLLVFGHNALDSVQMEGHTFQSFLWYIFHQPHPMQFLSNTIVIVIYPLIPWIGVMALGYCFGTLYKSEFSSEKRKKYLLRMGLGALLLFLVLRSINVYGDLYPWEIQLTPTFTFLSFINISKYPPSLDYLLVTIGLSLLILRILDNHKSASNNLLLVFGKVPFFYYILHLFVIHLIALLVLVFQGSDWKLMILGKEAIFDERLITYGYSLIVVYLVWILVVLFLYPFCKWYMYYKIKHKDNKYLSYL